MGGVGESNVGGAEGMKKHDMIRGKRARAMSRYSGNESPCYNWLTDWHIQYVHPKCSKCMYSFIIGN